MANQTLAREDHRYKSVLEAYNKGELWTTGPCRSTGCSAERPVNMSYSEVLERDSK